jgi:hypothetical protein
MDELTRRAFLRLLGGAGAAIPVASPLLKVLESIAPSAAPSTNTMMAQQIMNKLIEARGTDRYPVILDALKQIGYKGNYADFDADFKLYRDRRKELVRLEREVEAGKKGARRPDFGRGELHDEFDLEQDIAQDMYNTNPPEEPLYYPDEASKLSDFLDLYYTKPDSGEIPLTSREVFEQIRAEQDIYDAEAGRTGSYHGFEVNDERLKATGDRSLGLYARMDAGNADLFQNHPWHRAFDEAHRDHYIDDRADDAQIDEALSMKGLAIPGESAATTTTGPNPFGPPLPGIGQTIGAIRQGTKVFKQGKKILDALLNRTKSVPKKDVKQLTHQPAQTVDTAIKPVKEKVPIRIDELDDDIPF